MKGAKVENWTPVKKIRPLFKWKMRGAGSGKWPQRWRTVGESNDTLEIEPPILWIGDI